MVNSGIKREAYHIRWGDPLSATCDIHRTHELHRDLWNVRTETVSRIKCDDRCYILEARVVGYENENRVFEREFKRSIRRLVEPEATDG